MTKEESEIKALHASWDALLDQLGIDWDSEFEILVAEYLASGSLDATALDAVIERFAQETDGLEAHEAASKLIRRLIWDHRATDAELLADGREVARRARSLDRFTATALASKMTELPALRSTADGILDGCIEGLKSAPGGEIPEDDSTGRAVDPRIADAIIARNANIAQSATLAETVISIATRSGFGAREEAALSAATESDFDRELRNLDVDDLQAFTKKMGELLVAKQQYVPHFGDAMDRYARACAAIVADSSSGRLGSLIKTLFTRAGLGDLL